MAQAVGRANMGVTLDIGHMLFAGENPAQSVAAAAAAGRLFGVQLGDGHQRLGAEDGLMFGSVHPVAALEVVRWLQKSGCAPTDHVPCLRSRARSKARRRSSQFGFRPVHVLRLHR